MGEDMKLRFETIGSKGEQFAIDQAPETIRQMVAWEFWNNALYAGVFGIILSICLYALINRIRWSLSDEGRKEYDDENSVKAVVSVIVMIVTAIVFSICTPAVFIPAVTSAVRAKVAPNLVVIEKIKDIVKELK